MANRHTTDRSDHQTQYTVITTRYYSVCCCCQTTRFPNSWWTGTQSSHHRLYTRHSKQYIHSHTQIRNITNRHLGHRQRIHWIPFPHSTSHSLYSQTSHLTYITHTLPTISTIYGEQPTHPNIGYQPAQTVNVMGHTVPMTTPLIPINPLQTSQNNTPIQTTVTTIRQAPTTATTPPQQQTVDKQKQLHHQCSHYHQPNQLQTRLRTPQIKHRLCHQQQLLAQQQINRLFSFNQSVHIKAQPIGRHSRTISKAVAKWTR